MGGRVLTTHQLARLLQATPDVPVYSDGKSGEGGFSVIQHPHSVRITFGRDGRFADEFDRIVVD